MDTNLVSSGDPIADRRISYAQMLADAGDFAAAAELVAQALERTPDFLAGLELLGRFSEAAGQIPAAFAAWRRMLALDATDWFGAELRLAAHGALENAAAPALVYVETLFDAYAHDFDAALVQRLGYCVPQLIVDLLDRLGAQSFARALDLGCGTGLMGERLRQRCSYLEGVDLSAAMIGEARAKRIYDRAEQGEVLGFLAALTEKRDLMTAADVFAYLGDLTPVFAAAARVLAPGGLFVFSVEAHDGAEPCVLRPSLRYAHSEAGMRAGLAASGFAVTAVERANIRMDQGAPITGFLVAAQLLPVEGAVGFAVPGEEAADALPDVLRKAD